MHEITVEGNLGRQLEQLAGQAVLCDANGRALGLFSPLPDRPPLDQLQLEPPLSIAETQELRKVQVGKPLDQILSRLGIQ